MAVRDKSNSKLLFEGKEVCIMAENENQPQSKSKFGCGGISISGIVVLGTAAKLFAAGRRNGVITNDDIGSFIGIAIVVLIIAFLVLGVAYFAKHLDK